MNSFDRNCPLLILQNSRDQKKRVPGEQCTLAGEQLWGNDDIRDPGFIFHAQEQKTLGRPWALSDNDASRDAHQRSVAPVRQFDNGYCAEIARGVANIRHRMFSNSEARPAEVHSHPREWIHGWK